MSHSEDANVDSENKRPTSSGLSYLFNNQDKPLNAFFVTSKPPPIVSHQSDKDSCCSSSSAYFTASLPNSLRNQDWSDQSDGLSRTSSIYDNQSDYEVILDDGSRQKRTVSLSTIKVPSSNQFVQNSSSVLDQWMLNTRQKKKSKSNENTRLLDNMTHSVSSSSDNDDDDDNDNNTSFKHHYRLYNQWSQFKKQHLNLSYQQKMVLKCSFAYMIGSLFTFVPKLNALCGTHIASHMAATVTVFFNPAKSVGGIIEAAGFGWLYTLVALALSLASMYTNGFFLQRDMPLTASCVSVGFWLAGSTFVISYLKAKINTPSILTASGLAFIIIFTVIIRQGSGYQHELDFDIITETFSIVAIGTAISVFVCIFVWPMSASKKLRTNIDSSLSSTSLLLKLLTKTFLLDADLPEFTANKTLETALKSHTACFTSLKPALKDAKLEFYNLEMRLHADGYNKIVESIERLAQHVGGLRSSCGLQVEVMQKADHYTKNYGAVPPSSFREQQVNQMFNLKAGPQRKKMEHELKREREIGQYTSYFNIISDNKKDQVVVEEPVFSIEKKEGALVQFIRTVRSPMKSLAYTCKQTIIHLQARFMRKTTQTTPSFGLMLQNLANAIELFESSQHQALIRFYQRRFKKDIIKAENIHFLTPSDDIFLVYFFVFCLVEFAKELTTLVEVVQVVFEEIGEVDKSTSVLAWTKFFMNRTEKKVNQTTAKNETNNHKIFIPNNHNTLNTLHTPAPKTKLRKFFLRLWGFFSKFKSYQVRFASKSMITAVLISALAFIPATQNYFTEFKMEWTLITVMAVMTPTVGGTNLGAVLRIASTVLGCILAAVIYTLFHDYVVMLCLCTWLISIPSFWLILHHKHGRFGLFTLLAYNLVVLYKYKHRDDELVNVFELTWMRCVAVSLGVLIGLFVTAYIWPYEARTEVRKGLSDLLLRLSWLYKQLVAVYSEEDNSNIYHASNYKIHGSAPTKKVSVPVVDPSILTRQNKLRALELQKIELSIQLGIFDLQSLLVNAPNEPRLKGPFPTKTYTAMLICCQNILDKLLSLRIVILKDVWAIHIRRNFLLPASQEFMEMAGNVFLYLYLLASALQLKTPLPPYLPPAEKTRRLLMNKLQQLQAVMEGSIQSVELSEEKRDECYMVYYAYVVLMENIIRELDLLGGHMKDLFGSLVPDDQWARYFGHEIDLEQNQYNIKK